MAYPLEIKLLAKTLRRRGYSVKEISRKLKITQSTSSLWVRNEKVSPKGKSRLRQRRIFGQYMASQTWKKKRKLEQKENKKFAGKLIHKIDFRSKAIKQLLCAILYWCEGSKTGGTLKFSNSDPNMIHAFLKLLRAGFEIDESKLRMILHLHEYHDKHKQTEFWSGITSIPTNQFYPPYVKPHTGKRKKEGYPGCAVIHYGNVKILRRLKSLYNAFQQKIDRVVG